MWSKHRFLLAGSVGIIFVSLFIAHDGVGASAPAVQIDQIYTVFGQNAQKVPVSSTSGALAVVYVSSDGNSPAQTVSVSGGDLTWTLVARSNAQLGDAEIWSATTTSTSFSVT